MKLSSKQTNTALLATTFLTMGTTNAFAPVSHTLGRSGAFSPASLRSASSTPPLHMSSVPSAVDDEVLRLRSMAAKLRGEVAALEDEQHKAMAAAADWAFAKLDANGDGQVDLAELQTGLAKLWKRQDALPAERVQQLMQVLDTSGDGVLQRDEMRNVDQLRREWEALERQEKQKARNQAREAQREQQVAEERQAALALINDGEPTTQDKIVSVLPYLFPLLDGLQFVAPFIVQHADNPFAQAAAVAYGLYRSIPLGGFLAFAVLSTLSGNLGLNRLVRFNMQQAIYLDIAMFLPTLAVALVNLVGSATGAGGLPAPVTELTGEVLFAVLALNIMYAATSSLLGQAPDKIPFISKTVENRIPTVDDIMLNLEEFNKQNNKDTDGKQ